MDRDWLKIIGLIAFYSFFMPILWLFLIGAIGLGDIFGIFLMAGIVLFMCFIYVYILYKDRIDFITKPVIYFIAIFIVVILVGSMGIVEIFKDPAISGTTIILIVVCVTLMIKWETQSIRKRSPPPKTES